MVDIRAKWTAWFLVFCGIWWSTRASAVAPGYEKININISNFNGADNGQAFFTQCVLRVNTTVVIDVVNITPAVAFMIVQVHTQEKPVVLGYTNVFDNKSSVLGSNIGLHVEPRPADQGHELFIRNNNSEDIEALVAVVVYKTDAPIPGGCNMEFNLEISPFQKILFTDDIVDVDAQPAAAPPDVNGRKLPCEKNLITYEAYRLYIPEGDFSNETYFATISKMLTVSDITEFGEKVPAALSTSEMRRVYSAYPGTGSAYVMIATYRGHSSAYVPSFSYACSPLSEPESCYLLNTVMSKFLCATIFFIGLFLTFIGHGWFCAEMFLLGIIAGGVIGHTCLAAIGFENISTQLGLAFLIGIIAGIVSIALWYWFGMPCIAILQASLSLGALVASTTYFGIPDGIPLFESDANFWIVYAAIMIMVPLVLCIFPLSSNVVCCAFVGAYTIVLSIDYWLGSNLKYIIINTVRRIIVTEFNVATIHPPFQGKDIWLIVMWIVLALAGVHFQRKRLNGRPPFPSPANYTTIRSERMPILSNSRNGRRVLVLRDNDDVYHSIPCCLN